MLINKIYLFFKHNILKNVPIIGIFHNYRLSIISLYPFSLHLLYIIGHLYEYPDLKFHIRNICCLYGLDNNTFYWKLMSQFILF